MAFKFVLREAMRPDLSWAGENGDVVSDEQARTIALLLLVEGGSVSWASIDKLADAVKRAR